MENHKDLILQALNFGVSRIAPVMDEYLCICFPTMGFAKMFLERIDKLGIHYRHAFTDDYKDEIMIKVI